MFSARSLSVTAHRSLCSSRSRLSPPRFGHIPSLYTQVYPNFSLHWYIAVSSNFTADMTLYIRCSPAGSPTGGGGQHSTIQLRKLYRRLCLVTLNNVCGARRLKNGARLHPRPYSGHARAWHTLVWLAIPSPGVCRDGLASQSSAYPRHPHY